MRHKGEDKWRSFHVTADFARLRLGGARLACSGLGLFDRPWTSGYGVHILLSSWATKAFWLRLNSQP
jgi:hypothetical protein